MKALPNPIDNSQVLEADQVVPFSRRFVLRQRLRNRQAGVVGGSPAVVFDLSWSRHSRRWSGDRNSTRHYWSIVAVDLGAQHNFVSIEALSTLDRLGKVVGRTDISLGDAEFDRTFFVQSQPSSAAARILTSAVRSALVGSGLSSVDFYVRDQYLMAAARRPGRQRSIVEALPPVVSALRQVS